MSEWAKNKPTSVLERRRKTAWADTLQPAIWIEWSSNRFITVSNSINCLFYSSSRAPLLVSYSVPFLIHIFRRISKRPTEWMQKSTDRVSNRTKRTTINTVHKPIAFRIRFFVAYQIERPGCSLRGIGFSGCRCCGHCQYAFHWNPARRCVMLAFSHSLFDTHTHTLDTSVYASKTNLNLFNRVIQLSSA